jgi:diaminopimelate decarboxylase
MPGVLPDTASVSREGRLSIGGCDVVELADNFGTPVIVFDRATFENRALAFASELGPERVFYAGKAFCCVAVCELLKELGLGLDVCTGGELATAIAAGFPLDRVLFHGNNKSESELAAARDAGVGRIVIDSFEEMDRLEATEARVRLLIRITPGVEAHTHEFVQTGQEDSKFGFGLGDGVAREALRRALRIPRCEVVGVHAHIGSQIFELAAFELAIKRLAGFLAASHDEFGFTAGELNLGGGLGIAHTEDEMTPDVVESIQRIVAAVEREFPSAGLPVPDVFVEPGRSMVGSSAVTVYRVGTVKRIPGIRTFGAREGMAEDVAPAGMHEPWRTYVAVDGGMGDNIRPPLYGAKYESFLANRANSPADLRAEIVGKFCESGDYLVRDARLPQDVARGDLLCIPATGAYTYSMASNYNRQPRPGVVMVDAGMPTEIIRRETYDDVLSLDRRLDGSALPTVRSQLRNP